MDRCPRPSCGGALIVEHDEYGLTRLCLLCGRRWPVPRPTGEPTRPRRSTGKRGRPKGDIAEAPRGYLTALDVAKALGLSRQTIQGRLWRHEVVGAILDAGHWIIPATYLTAAPRDGRRKAVSA